MKTKKQDLDSCQTIEYLHTQAVNYHKENKLNEALALYLQSIELEENQPAWIYGNAITVSAQIGDYDLGVELKHKAETIYPDSGEVQRSIGLLFEKLNDFNKAVDHYSKSVELNTQQPEWVYLKLLDLLTQLDLYEQVIETKEKAVLLFPESLNFQQRQELVKVIDSTEVDSYFNQIQSFAYNEGEQTELLASEESRETPIVVEDSVDLDIKTLRRKSIDFAILERYETLLKQVIYDFNEGVETMNTDALIHCLAEIKTDIHYLKTKLLDTPAEAVDPQAKQGVDLEKFIRFHKPMPIKCELKERIVGSGWHKPEEHGRWTGPGTISSVVLPYPVEGKYKFEMIVRAEAELDLIKTLRININDEPLAISIIQPQNKSSFPLVVRGNLTVSNRDEQSFLAVDLIIDKTLSVSGIDDRLIGLLIEMIYLIPQSIA